MALFWSTSSAPTVAFPGIEFTYDPLTRANGAASAGAGSTIWDTQDLGGATPHLVVASNALAVDANDGGALTVGSDQDQLRTFRVKATGGYFAWFYRIQSPTTSNWTAYWLLVNGLDWTLFKRTTGGGSNTTVINVTTGSTLSVGEQIGIRVYGNLHEAYVLRSGSWSNVYSVTDSSISAAGVSCMQLGSTSFRADTVQSGYPNLQPPGGAVTIYVDPDHAGASDTYDRATASDPSTPVRTIKRGCELAFATQDWADTVSVEVATVADATNIDPRMYPVVDFDRFVTSSIPFRDNSANQKIIVQGVRSGSGTWTRGVNATGAQPIWAGHDDRSLKNWEFRNFQIGYDSGAVDGNGDPLDVLGVRSSQRPEDVTHRDIHFTWGVANVEYWTGELLYEDCTINAPLSKFQGQGQPYDGRGFGFSSAAGDPLGGNHAGHATIRRCTLDGIRGNDAVQAGLGVGDGSQIDAQLLVEDCLFHNVTENGPGGNPNFHTDSVQVLGGYRFIFRRNVYIGCTNALMCSDYENYWVTFENNLIYGGGAPVQGQGFHIIEIWHNTILGAFFADSAIIIFAPKNSPADMTYLLTCVNNLTSGISIASGVNLDPDSLIDKNAVTTDPGGTSAYGSNLSGLPEMGTSARMSGLPTTTLEGGSTVFPTNYELANTPVVSPGIGQGREGITGLPSSDRLGRAFPVGARDIGCHQSDPAVAVATTARSPYVISRSPTPGATGVGSTSSVSIVLYPKPGEGIDPSTINATTFFAMGPSGGVLPVTSVALSGPNGSGHYTVALDVDGEFMPWVVYSVRMTQSVQDTEGSHLAQVESWNFRAAGTDPAIVTGGSSPGTSIDWYVSSF